MPGSKRGAGHALDSAATAERGTDIPAAVVKLLECEASGDPETAEEEKTEKRSKNGDSSCFELLAPAALQRLWGWSNVPALFSLVKTPGVTICKVLKRRRCSARARGIPQAELTYRC